MKKIITIVALLLMVMALCIACQDPNSGKPKGGDFTLTVRVTRGTAVIKAGNDTIKSGATVTAKTKVTITAKPRTDGYIASINATPTVAGLTGNGTAAKPWTFKMPSAGTRINITFSEDGVDGGEEGELYTIYTTATNGTLELNSETKEAIEHETIQVTAAPSSSAYQLVKGSFRVVTQSETIDVTTLSETEEEGEYEFDMPAANVVVSVSFSKIPTDENGEPVTPLTNNQIFSGGVFNNAVLTGYNNRHVPWYCDDEGRRQGGQAIRVGPDEFSEDGAGFSITRNAGYTINLGEVNALSFWAKSPDGIRIQFVQFGTDTTNGSANSITYTGEDGSGIAINNPEWTRYLIPIPGSRGAPVDGVFTLRIDRREEGRTLYIDDIEYIAAAVSLQSVVLSEPDTISTAETTPVSKIIRGMKAVYTVDGTTVSLFAGNINFASYHTVAYNVTGAASLSGETVTAVTLGGTYTLSATLDSVAGQVTGRVSATRFMTIEDCAPAGVGLLEGNVGFANAGLGDYYATSWDAAFEEANGIPYLKVFNRRWDGYRDWDREGVAGRRLATDLNLTPYNKIILTIRAGSPGLAFHFRLWQGGTADNNRFSTAVRLVSNVWQEVEIPLPSGFRNSERGDTGNAMGNKNNITRWEIATDYNNFNENYLYVGSIRASE